MGSGARAAWEGPLETGTQREREYRGRRTELGVMCRFSLPDMKLGYSGKA